MLIFILLLIILLVIITVAFEKETYVHRWINRPRSVTYTSSGVPRIIWSYWHSERIPTVVHLCVQTWARSNPSYQINLLTRKTYEKFVTLPKNAVFYEFHARTADLLRLTLLKKYGGVWLDASMIWNEPLDTWLSAPKNFFAFYLKKGSDKYPHIEVWFLAAPRSSPFITLWLDEFMELGHMTPREYALSRRKMGVNIDKIDNWNYLSIYISSRKVLQIDGISTDDMSLRVAERGPYAYLAAAKWNARHAINLARRDPSLSYILKMTSSVRSELLRDDLNNLFSHVLPA